MLKSERGRKIALLSEVQFTQIGQKWTNKALQSLNWEGYFRNRSKGELEKQIPVHRPACPSDNTQGMHVCKGLLVHYKLHPPE